MRIWVTDPIDHSTTLARDLTPWINLGPLIVLPVCFLTDLVFVRLHFSSVGQP